MAILVQAPDTQAKNQEEESSMNEMESAKKMRRLHCKVAKRAKEGIQDAVEELEKMRRACREWKKQPVEHTAI
eukprot:12260795-Karenia_brevis.AAC.1